jgi:hypothetical protein
LFGNRKEVWEELLAAHKILLGMRSHGAPSINDAKELETVDEKLRKWAGGQTALTSVASSLDN